MSNYEKKIYYVTQAQYDILLADGTITVGGISYTGIDPNASYFVRSIPDLYELAWDDAEDQIQLLKNGAITGDPLTVGYANYATNASYLGGQPVGSFVRTSGDQSIQGIKTFTNTIVGSISGNAGTATKLATARTFTITDNDATNSQAAETAFDGSANFTVKLPSTIKASLTGTATNVTGTVAIANGGTGQTNAISAFKALSPMTTIGDMIYAGGDFAIGTRLAGNMSATRKFLLSVGNGIQAAEPSWDTVTKTDVGLSNVDNTSDANKPVSTATQTALNLKANLASPTFTGTPLSVTATKGTNTTQIATTAFVQTAVGDYVAKNTAITGAAKTKITYDSKGLVTAGENATLDDIGDGSTRKLTDYLPLTGGTLTDNLTIATGKYLIADHISHSGSLEISAQSGVDIIAGQNDGDIRLLGLTEIKPNLAGSLPLKVVGYSGLTVNIAEFYNNNTLKLSINKDGQLVSPIATGTSPLSVTSTTVNTNLNADKLDGADLETTLSTTSDVKIPSSKAIATYIANKNYLDSSSTLSSSKLSGDLPSAISETLPMTFISAVSLVQNISGKPLTTFVVDDAHITDIPYPYVVIKRADQAFMTTTDMKTYMKAISGSTFLPSYNYDNPKFVYIMDASGVVWKPQLTDWIELRMYKMPDVYVKSNIAIAGTTKTKITYDSKGLVTAGADASLADLSDISDDTPAVGNLLRYNGEEWAPASASGTYAGPTETYLGGGTSSGYISVADIDNFDEIIIELYTFYTYYWDQSETDTSTDFFVTRTILPHNKFEHYHKQNRDDSNNIGATLTTVNMYSNDIISVQVYRRNTSGTELVITFRGTLSGFVAGTPWGAGVRIYGRNW